MAAVQRTARKKIPNFKCHWSQLKRVTYLALPGNRNSEIWYERFLHGKCLKPCHPQLSRGLTEDGFDGKAEFCKSFLNTIKKDVEPRKFCGSEGAVLKLNGHVSHHHHIYRPLRSPQQTTERELNVPGAVVWIRIWTGLILKPLLLWENSKRHGKWKGVVFYKTVLSFVHARWGVDRLRKGCVQFLGWKSLNFYIVKREIIEWSPRCPNLIPPPSLSPSPELYALRFR